MDVLEAIRTRRSIRAYTDQPVGRDLIETLIADAAQAPPPFAGQVPWTFNVIDGAERIAAFGAQALQYARDHRPDGPGWHWVEREDLRVFWNAPAVVIISGPVEDCCRAGQLLLLAAHARGLGACWVGAPMLWLRSDAGKAAVGIPEEATPVAAICLGYAAEVPQAPAHAAPRVIWG